ncbi:MAG: hypothetical protein JW765_08100 [Deltaproteobacteria bacterium]|nr:hypothetical protein [Candidatus Zymogenaceae bacterium]
MRRSPLHTRELIGPLVETGLFLSGLLLFILFYRIDIADTARVSLYGVLFLLVPGLLVAAAVFREVGAERSMVQGCLAIIAGFLLIFLSYMSWALTHYSIFLFLPALSYLALFKRPVARKARDIISTWISRFVSLDRSTRIILLLFILITYVYFLVPRPTPGLDTVCYYPDVTFDAGLAASLARGFPPLNLQMPGAGPLEYYHFFSYCVIAHAGLITKVPVSLVSIQHIFILYVPIFCLSVFFLIRYLTTDPFYLAWGFFLSLFSSNSTHLVFDYYLFTIMGNISTFLAMALFFLIIYVLSQEQLFWTKHLLLIVTIGAMLLTFTKGPGGVVFSIGALLWSSLLFMRGRSKVRYLSIGAGASISFALTYIAFFLGGPRTAYFYPLDTLFLKSGLDYYHLPSCWYIVAAIAVLSHFSFRIVGPLFFLLPHSHEKGKFAGLLVCLAVSAYAIYFSMRVFNIDYFALFGLAALNLLVLAFITRFDIYTVIKESIHRRRFVIAFLLILFLFSPAELAERNIRKWVSLSIPNILSTDCPAKPHFSGRPKSEVPDTLNRMEPSLYETLVYIRDHTPPNVIVVSPVFSFGQALTSCFSERMVFYEGYPSVVNPSDDVKKTSEAILDGIYERGEIPAYMLSPGFVLIIPAEKNDAIAKLYTLCPTFSNESWVVFTF